MKKFLAFFGFLATLSALALFGWGCNKTTQNAQRTANYPRPRADNVVQQPATQAATSSQDITPMEPQALAYLLLTQDAKVTVSRDGQSMQGVSEMELLDGDTIQVTAGEARLLYPDTGMSVLEQGTKVELVPDGTPKQGGVGLQIMLEAGKIWTRLERLLGADENLSVDANNVVATVRGTGFGVQLIGGDVDVTVADHQVTVSTHALLNTGKEVSQSVLLAAGSGLRIDPATISKMTDMRTQMLKDIRKLTTIEKAQPGYLFGLRKIQTTELKRPERPFIWSAAMVLDDRLKARLSPENLRRIQANILWFQAHRAELLQAERDYLAATSTPVRFQPPLRDINLLEVTPTGSPSLKGPSS